MKRGKGMKIFAIVSVIVLAIFYLYYRCLDLQVSTAGDGTADAGAPDAAPDQADPAEDPAPETGTEVPAEAAAPGDRDADSSPEAPPISFFLKKARENKEAGNRDKACEYAREAIAVSKDSAEIWLFEGYCALEYKKPQGAVKAFNGARNKGVEQMDLAVIGLAESFRRQNKIKTALKYYETYLAEFPDGPDAAVAKKYAKAIALCLVDDRACKPDLRKPAPLSFW
jgi:tetratricopeptide (TPR) repeat protein